MQILSVLPQVVSERGHGGGILGQFASFGAALGCLHLLLCCAIVGLSGVAGVRACACECVHVSIHVHAYTSRYVVVSLFVIEREDKGEGGRLVSNEPCHHEASSARTEAKRQTPRGPCQLNT